MTMVTPKREGERPKRRTCRYCGERVSPTDFILCEECGRRICLYCAIVSNNNRYCEECANKLNIKDESSETI